MHSSKQKIEICKGMVIKRLADMPNNNLYRYARKQIEFIESKLLENGKLTPDDYGNVKIGLMCAKELENIDDEFCDAVYNMKSSIRPENYEV